MKTCVELFGTAVLIKLVEKKLAGGLVLANNKNLEGSQFMECHVAAIGPDVKNIAAGDVAIMNRPTLHQRVMLDMKGKGIEEDVYLIDEAQIKGKVTR